MEKIKNIEFLRVMGCFSIVALHLFHSWEINKSFPNIDIFNKLYVTTSKGEVAVDLFFILSGFFLLLTFDKNKTICGFLKAKIFRLYPVFIYMLILAFVFHFFGLLHFDLYNNILALFGFSGTGLAFDSGNIVSFWYVSSMLWGLLLYFYILKYYDKKHINLFAALVIFFSYTFMIHANNGIIRNHLVTYSNCFNSGLLRALGGISIGYLIAYWYKNNIENINKYIPSIKSMLFLTIVEFLCLFFIINNLMFHKIKFNNDFIFIIIFTLIVIIFLINKGFISKILNNDIWVQIGKYTFSLYMTHSMVIRIFKYALWKTTHDFFAIHPILNIAIVLISVLLFGIFTYHFIEIPAKKYLTTKFCNVPQTHVAAERERGRVITLVNFLKIA